MAAALVRSTFDRHAKSTKGWGESQLLKEEKKKGCRQKSRDSPAVSSREFNPRVVQQFEIECEKNNKQRKKLGVHKNKRLKQISEPSKWNQFFKRQTRILTILLKFLRTLLWNLKHYIRIKIFFRYIKKKCLKFYSRNIYWICVIF